MAKRTWLFIIYLIIGLYVFNLGLNFVQIPESITFLNSWLMMAAGVIAVLESFKFLREVPY